MMGSQGASHHDHLRQRVLFTMASMAVIALLPLQRRPKKHAPRIVAHGHVPSEARRPMRARCMEIERQGAVARRYLT